MSYTIVQHLGLWFVYLNIPLLVFSPGLAFAQEGSAYSCDAIDQIPANERCTYLRTECEYESRLPYTEWYFCSIQPYGVVAEVLYVLLALLLLPLLFCLLGNTAELYFSPVMALVSQTIPKMRPRFAGVTFVALGNGAPDLSSNVAAISQGGFSLSAGAVTGGAMFVQCFVAGEVIRISKGVPCRGALIRDIATYCVSILIVLATFAYGKIGIPFIVIAIIIYAMYVAWVFIGDEWHEKGRPKFAELVDRMRPREADSPGQPLLPWAPYEVEHGGVVPLSPTRAAAPVAAAPRFMDSRTYKLAVWADLAQEPLSEEVAGELGGRGSVEAPQSGQQDHRQGQQSGSGSCDPTPVFSVPATPAASPHEGEEDAQLPPPQHPTSRGSYDMAENDRGQGAEASTDWGRIWRDLQTELMMGANRDWEEYGKVLRWLREMSFRLLLPAYVLLRLTIPMVDPETYNPQWLVASVLFCPIACLFYFDALQSWPVLLAMAVGAVAAAAVFLLTRGKQELPPCNFGTGFAFAPALCSLLGFFMGVLWIDTLATEVVGLVTLLANLAHMPSGVAGLTVLAWGNSLGDLFGNPALARRGQSSTALTACFASPLFNLLVALALGFTGYLSRHGATYAEVQLTPEMALGIVFLVLYNVITILVGMVNNKKIPSRYYLFARAWYAIYFGLACYLGFKYS